MSLLTDLLRERKISVLFKTFCNKVLRKKTVPIKIEESTTYFVLSTGRVGTQTLAAILSNASETLSFHEPSPFLYSLSQKSYMFNDEQAWEILSQVFLLLREKHLKLSLLNEKKYIETSPQGTFIAPAIKKVLPNTKFLHLVRSPDKVIRSGMNRGWYSGHSYDKYRIKPRKESPFYQKWKNFSSLEKNVWLWTETNNWILDYLYDIKDDEQLMVHSEKIFDGDRSTLENLFSFFGVEKIKQKAVNNVLSKKLNDNKTSEIDNLNLKDIDNELLDYYNLVKKKMGFK